MGYLNFLGKQTNTLNTLRSRINKGGGGSKQRGNNENFMHHNKIYVLHHNITCQCQFDFRARTWWNNKTSESNSGPLSLKSLKVTKKVPQKGTKKGTYSYKKRTSRKLRQQNDLKLIYLSLTCSKKNFGIWHTELP